jgi:hypothetical protein
MESISNDNVSTFDETVPTPAEVEREFHEHAGDGVTAIAWLADHGIDAAPQQVALIQYGMVWNPDASRYRFLIYAPDHIGPKYPPELAMPIIEDGKFIDLLFISDEMSFARATCRAAWLGRANLTGPVVRLHAHPMDWLEAGCAGACHIEPISRKALKDLRGAETIESNDIHTALDAWEWGFGGEDDALARFSIDDSAASIRRYFRDEADWRTAYLARESEA